MRVFAILLFFSLFFLVGCSTTKYNSQTGNADVNYKSLGTPSASKINAITKQMAIDRLTTAVIKETAKPNPNAKSLEALNTSIALISKMNDLQFKAWISGRNSSTMDHDVYSSVKHALLTEW